MKNLFVFLRFALTVFVICTIFDFITNKSFVVEGLQLLSSGIISIFLGIVFTIILFRKTYIISRQSVSLDDLKKNLEKEKFKIVEKTDKYFRFRGNYSYLFYVGDIEVVVMDKEIRLYGTKYVLRKVLAGI